MSNEEYALEIQQGNTELYRELWENMRGLIYKHANKFVITHSQRCATSGVTFEDIIQSSFVALAGAVKDYKAEKGYLLSTYLTLHLKCVYNELIGRRTQKIDLLNICESLNVPIGNDNDTELMDTVADTANSPEELDERIFQKELSTVLHKCVDSLPDELRAAIKGRYFDKLTYAEIEKQQHLSNGGSRVLLSKAFCKLRSCENRRRLKPFADEIISRSLHSSGLNAFINLQASCVELTAEYLERKTH